MEKSSAFKADFHHHPVCELTSLHCEGGWYKSPKCFILSVPPSFMQAYKSNKVKIKLDSYISNTEFCKSMLSIFFYSKYIYSSNLSIFI